MTHTVHFPCGDEKPRLVWAAWQHLWQPLDELLLPSGLSVEVNLPVEFQPLLEYLLTEHPIMMSPNASGGIDWTQAQSLEFIESIRIRVPGEKSFVLRRRALEVLDAGNRLGRWRIPIVSIVAPLPPAPASHFQAESFESMCLHSPFVDEFIRSLETPLAPDDVIVLWGRLFASAMLFGGLVDAKWLLSIGEALNHAPGDLRWLELSYKAKADAPVIRMRWFPDPVSRHLMHYMRQDGVTHVPKINRLHAPNVYRLIDRYASGAGIDKYLPRNWANLKSMVSVRMGLYVSPHLVAYALGKTVSSSLPEDVWDRVMSPPDGMLHEVMDVKPRSGDDSHEGVVGGDEEDAEVEEEAEQDELWPQQLRELASEIRRQGAGADSISTWLDSRNENLLPSVKRLAEWVRLWLFSDVRGRRKLRQRTVYELFNAASGRLVGQLGYTDPTSLQTEEEYLELYTVALEDTSSPASRRRVRRGIKSFHAFLEKHYTAPSLEGSGIFHAGGRVNSQVDANLITPELFERALRCIELEYPEKPETAELLKIIAALGYYAGLRRSEAIGIVLSEIEGVPDWDLVLAPNIYRGLKSTSAHRVLPLKLLLPPHHLDALIALYQKRLDAMIDGGELSKMHLFELEDGTALRDTSPLLDKITVALRQVTHSPSVRFHHLRHSFANRMLLVFWLYEHQSEGLVPKWLPELTGLIDPCLLRESLLGKSLLQRRSLRQISRLLGHSGSDITCEHYLHLLDLLLGCEVVRTIPELSEAQFAAISGYSASHIRRLKRIKKPQSSAAFLEILFEHRDGAQVEQPSINVSKPHLKVALPESPTEQLMLMARALQATASASEGGLVYPWGDKALRQALSEIANLPAGILFSSDRPSRWYGLFDMPKSVQGKELVGRVMQQGLGRGFPALQEFTRWWLPGTKLNVRLGTLKEVKQWSDFIDAMGLKEEFTLHHLAKPGSKAGSAQIQHQYWRGKLVNWPLSLHIDHELPTLPSRGGIEFRQRTDSTIGGPQGLFVVRWAIIMCNLLSSVTK